MKRAQITLGTIRAVRGLSQVALSILTGILAGTIAAVEVGYRQFTPEAKENIRRALKLSEHDARYVRELL